jgi:tetratricopeptide (TPR) repeat protein
VKLKTRTLSSWWSVLTLLLALSLLSGWPGWAASPLDDLKAKLARWEIEPAWDQAQQLLARKPLNPELLELAAYLAFYRGDYSQALTKARDALANGAKGKHLQNFQLFVQRTHDIVRQYRSYTSPHFELRLDENRDGILAGYLLDALEKTYQRMGRQFNSFPRERIRVEVMPGSQSFYYVSGLSRRDIEVSGAVGLAKYNKVMLLSPRALVYGYRYLDAVSHEYLHYLIVKLSGNKAPIWFHEGLAKFEEAKWRSASSLYLSPLNQTLLARAVRTGEFIGFDKMEPSLVQLETPEQVQLAYAEAASAVEYIVDRAGYAGLRDIMTAMAASEEAGAGAAVKKVMGLSMAELQAGWKEYLTLREIDGVGVRNYKVRKSARDEQKLDLNEIKSIMARNWVTLGDMLRAKRRLNAALIEYRKALKESPASVPILNKLSLALILLNKDEEAIKHLNRAEKIAPDHPTVHANLGYAYLRLKKYQPAKEALYQSLSINPFDPRVHQGLAQAYQELGQRDEAEKEMDIARKLLSHR